MNAHRVGMTLLLAGLCVVCPLAGLPADDVAPLRIVDGGQARAVIVVPEDAAATVSGAATELQDYIEQVSGARLEIVSEADAQTTGPCIAVGNTTLAEEAGVSVASADPETFRIVRRGDVVYLLGGSESPYHHPRRSALGCGVEYAAYEFLERVCGIRWLRPGPGGTLIPDRNTLDVGDLDLEQEPSYGYRSFTYWYEGKAAWVTGTDYDKERAKREGDMLREWMKHNKTNGMRLVPGGHTFHRIVPKSEYEEHPELFALVAGSRKPEGSRSGGWQLCTSNPEVVDRAVEYVRGRFDRGDMLVAISPNDGGGFCECENCRALDVPGWEDERGHPVLSNRIATFVNAVARRVKDDYPGCYVGTMAYGYYKEPPRGITFEPNVMVWLINRQWYNWVPGEREKYYDFYETWRQVQPDVYVSSGEFFTHEHRCGVPWSIITLDADAIKWAADRYKTKVGWGGIQNDWGTNGLKYYVAARLFWNADQELEDVLAEYCASMYGAAAAPMRRYWERLEKGDRDWQRTLDGPVGLKEVVLDMYEIVSPAVRQDCREYLEQAAALADTDWARGSVRFTTRGFDYTQMTVEAFEAYHELFEAREEADVVRLTDALRANWQGRLALVEEQRDERIVGYAQYHLDIQDKQKFGGQITTDQRFAFFGHVEVDKLRNGGVEDELRGSWWHYMGPSLRVVTDAPHGGERCLALESWRNDAIVLQTLMLVPGHKYRLSAWMRAESVTGRAWVRALDMIEPSYSRVYADGVGTAWRTGDGEREIFDGTFDWREVSCEFTPESPEVRVDLFVGGGDGTVFFDDFKLERLD
jgi:hypothetical protein